MRYCHLTWNDSVPMTFYTLYQRERKEPKPVKLATITKYTNAAIDHLNKTYPNEHWNYEANKESFQRFMNENFDMFESDYNTIQLKPGWEVEEVFNRFAGGMLFRTVEAYLDHDVINVLKFDN